MPKSALPEGFIQQADGTGTDWDNGIQKYWNKAWFAYGPRATEWWARWRKWPITLFAIRGKGPYRIETDLDDHKTDDKRVLFWVKPVFCYLSAIQYWTKWHVAIQWPLQIQAHYYIDEVPEWPDQAGSKRVFYIRLGARRDADMVYWFPSLFIGLQWN